MSGQEKIRVVVFGLQGGVTPLRVKKLLNCSSYAWGLGLSKNEKLLTI